MEPTARQEKAPRHRLWPRAVWAVQWSRGYAIPRRMEQCSAIGGQDIVVKLSRSRLGAAHSGQIRRLAVPP